MPLREHFHPPLSDHRCWDALHGGWPMMIAVQLNQILPDRYVAEPRVQLADTDEYEVRIFDRDASRRLVAAIEVISPANKDWPESRSQFVNKCAALLRQRVSVVLVDVVTSRDFNLYAELLESIDERDPSLGEDPPFVYAAACRWRPQGAGHVLEAWNNRLTIGQSLPTLPLWLSDDLAVPLDLELSYEQTCKSLRIA